MEEFNKNVLRKFIPEEALNETLLDCTCVRTMDLLLDLKLSQVTTNKIPLSFSQIYSDDLENIELHCRVLKKIFLVTAKPENEFQEVVKIIIDNNNGQHLIMLKLLNVLLELAASSETLKGILLNSCDFSSIVMTVLKKSSKSEITFLITQFLPHCFILVDKENILLEIYKFVEATDNFHILCLLDSFIYESHSLLFKDNFWTYLAKSTTSKDNYTQKQAIYILSKALNYSFENKLIHDYLKSTLSQDEVEKVWKQYFILIDASNEKQLHLIEPSLKMLHSIQALHSLWRMSLYKILLNHSQNSVVYFVANFILDHEKNFNEIIDDFLSAINKNEYSKSLSTFKALQQFVLKLNQIEFVEFLEASLEITWIPASAWRFHCTVFNEHTKCSFSYTLLRRIIKSLELVPNIYVRKGCMKVVFECFIKNFEFTTVEDLLNSSFVMLENDREIFESFVKNESTFLEHEESLEIIFKDGIIKCENLKYLEMQLKIFHILQRQDVYGFVNIRYIRIRPEVRDLILSYQRCYSSCSDTFLPKDINDENVEKVIHELNEDWEDNNETLSFLEDILCTKSANVLFEHFDLLMQHKSDEQINNFIEKSMREFFVLCSSDVLKTASKISFIDCLFKESVIDDRVVLFSQTILSHSNNKNRLALILSKKISSLAQNSLLLLSNFSQVVVELLLHGGLLINRNDRVEYWINQEIARKLGKFEENPNLNDLMTRLYALDGMLAVKCDLFQNIADNFASLLMERYMKHFNKRYFPDSQVHLEKLRIFQALLLLHPHLKDQKNPLIELIAKSFLTESHQSSVKHLMQWLLICLLNQNADFALSFISEKIKMMNNSRPTSISSFIPVLYHLCIQQNPEKWGEFVDILLPCMMGAQFKLRLLSQMAFVKLYEKAVENQFDEFFNSFQSFYVAAKEVVGDSSNNEDFLEYFSVDQCNFSSIYYVIPKINKVTCTEWENLYFLKNEEFQNIEFEDIPAFVEEEIGDDDKSEEFSENIQKKITPWRESLEDNQLENNLVLVTSLVEKAANLGGLARTCEVFGVKKLVMKTAKIVADKEFKSLSMSSENWVDITEVKVEELKALILETRAKGFCVVGAEQTSESVKLNEFKFPKSTMLLLGNEKQGISPDLIPLLDYCIEIPQLGVVRSLNVHVAGAVIIWEYCKQHLF